MLRLIIISSQPSHMRRLMHVEGLTRKYLLIYFTNNTKLKQGLWSSN